METTKNDSRRSKFFIAVGRGLSLIALLALIAAWASEFTNNEVFGLSTQHLFNDAIVLSLLSLVCLLDGFLHSKNL